jgi:hypothetical protein
MEHIAAALKNIERTIKFDGADAVSAQGFTQVPNFILKNPNISLGAKVTYAMLISYGWHNDFCFPGQDRLAADMGMSRSRTTEFVSELEKANLITIQRRGQGKTNIYTIHFRVKGKQARRPTA